MSPLPGVTYETRDSSGTSGPPLDTATAFIAGLAERGPTDRPVFVSTPSKYESVYGGEVPYGYLDDAAEIFPDEQAAGAWLLRVVGKGAKTSTANLEDGEGDTLQVDGVSPGKWADDITVDVEVAGGNFTLVISYNKVEVESETFATTAEAIAWAENSEYIRLKDLGGGDPEAQTVSLAGGDDDRASITDEDRAAALELFTADLGPGQVLYPGATTTAMYTALLQHAESHNRTAILDGADTATVATLTGAATTLRALGDPARCGGLFAPWHVVPGPAAATTKTIPPSIIQAALIARRDRETFDPLIGVCNPNSAAAGVKNDAGVSKVATGLSQEPWTDAQRETLNDAGVNVIRIVYNQVVTYGYRTLTSPVTDQLNIWLNNRRIDMAIIAAQVALGEEFNFGQVDGRGRKLAEFAAAISGRVMMPYWEVDALFGDSSEEAYHVETGDQVNPIEQLAKGEVRAETEVKRSPLIERTKLIYVRRAL